MAPTGISVGPDGVARCSWSDSEDLKWYHDLEWGRPVADDHRLFEKLILEGFMSGLSWLTILRKRDNFRAAFRGFDPAVVGRFGARDAARLMKDAGIVRNRAKIDATINNARLYPKLVGEFGSFAAYAWRFEPKPRTRLLRHEELMRVAASDEAAAMSKDLRRRGWGFVGPTTVYSFMQAMGLVNDHVRGCAVGVEVERLRREFVRPGR
ncbi:MAG: DNA-3-methyladenine glycosylase I [Chloroflexi bacterium]|nr:MAG: DNA-3-methyladenine glycosylase I [Chloroflexota bacterium]